MVIKIKQKELHISRKQVYLLVLNVFLIAVFLIMGGRAQSAREALYSQQAAARWEDKAGSYAQVSAFISPNLKLQQEGIAGIRSSVMETLSADSLNENSEGGRVWLDAFSGECQAQVRRENNVLSVTAVGVGGDFFQFHPLPLLSGSYISDEDLNQDRIVVDENFAWAMFGSNDIVGMQIWMGNVIYTIAGVVAVDDDSLYQIAYGESNRIYVPYTMLQKQQEQLQITCYEAIMPNPISNYGYRTLRKAFGIEEEAEEAVKKPDNPLNFEDVEVVDNSVRFDFVPLWKGIANRKYQMMHPAFIGYPFWENLARLEEQQQQNILILRLLLLICPFVCLVLWLYKLWHNRKWTVKGLVLKTYDRILERQAQRAEERRAAKEAEEAEVVSEEAENAETDEIEAVSEEEIVETEATTESEPEDEAALQSVTSEDIFHI